MNINKDDQHSQCLHTIQTNIEVMKSDISSIKEMVEKNIESDAENLKKHGEQIANLKEEVAEMRGKSMGSNNLGQIILSVAIVIVTLLTIFFK